MSAASHALRLALDAHVAYVRALQVAALTELCDAQGDAYEALRAGLVERYGEARVRVAYKRNLRRVDLIICSNGGITFRRT